MSTEPEKTLCRRADYLLGTWTGWRCYPCMPSGTSGVCVQSPFSVKRGTGTMKWKKWSVLCSRFDCHYRLPCLLDPSKCQNLPISKLLQELGGGRKQVWIGKKPAAAWRRVPSEAIINSEVRTRSGSSTWIELLKIDHRVLWGSLCPTFPSPSFTPFLHPFLHPLSCTPRALATWEITRWVRLRPCHWGALAWG